VRAILIEQGIDKANCLGIVERWGIALPRSYAMGFPNANCLQSGCVKGGLSYWSRYRFYFPAEFAETAAQAREIGARLVKYKGKRIFIDEIPADYPMTDPIVPACDFLCAAMEPPNEVLSRASRDGLWRIAPPIGCRDCYRGERGWTVENPDQHIHQDAYREHGMQHFLDVVEDCSALAFLRFEDGYIGAGVAKEIECALRHGIPVYDVSEGSLDPVGNMMPECVLTVEQTRAKLAYLRSCPLSSHERSGE
jgi:hypothetical protein